MTTLPLRLAAVLALAGLGLMSACTTTTARSMRAISASDTPGTPWVDQPVSFQAGGLTVYATYRHPAAATSPMPAVLLIAGSGPTDRNGNSALLPGPVGTLQAVADWLSADGVASLRYDKLGSGQTGLGPYVGHPSGIGIVPSSRRPRPGCGSWPGSPESTEASWASSATARATAARPPRLRPAAPVARTACWMP